MNTSQKSVLELAKQGNTKAIAALVNKSLSSHGISVSGIQIVNGLLTIKLKSETDSISKTAIQKIQSSAQKLSIQSVKNVEVIDDTKKVEVSNLSNTTFHESNVKRDAQKSSEATPKDLSHSRKVTIYSNKKNPFFDFNKFIKPRNLLIVGGSSGIGLVSLVVFMAIGFGSSSSCKVDGQPAHKVLESFDGEWSDSVELAHSTSRMSLSGQIKDLQDIKRKVEKTQWGKCSQPAATFLAEAMDDKIDGFIKFLDPDNSESSIDTDFESSVGLMWDYHLEYIKLLPRKERILEEREIVESRAKVNLSTIDTQQVISLVRDRAFVKRFEDFDDDLKFEPTQDVVDVYDFNIIEASESKFVATATAKKKDFKSYSIGMFGKDNDFESIRCESNKPSKTINSPQLVGTTWSCPSDSEKL
jgi:hypothetical protein